MRPVCVLFCFWIVVEIEGVLRRAIEITKPINQRKKSQPKKRVNNKINHIDVSVRIMKECKSAKNKSSCKH